MNSVLRAVVACGVTTGLLVGFAGPAAAVPDPAITNSSPAGYYLGGDGRLHSAGPGSTGPVSTAVIGPPGGNVAAVRRSDGGAAVFTIDNSGSLVAGFTSSGGAGMGFVRHPQTGLAPPGGRITAVQGLTGMHVFFPGSNGSIYHAMYTRPGNPYLAPAPAVPPGTVLPSTSVAGFHVSDRFGVVFTDGSGRVRTVSGFVGSGAAGPIAAWTTSSSTPPGMTRPGSPVAAASAGNRVTAFYNGGDGTLWRLPFSGLTPQPAVALSGPGAVPAGAHLAATLAATGQFVVAYVGADGSVRAATDEFGPQPVPWVVSPPGVHVPGGPLSLGYDDNGYLHIGWCGTDRWIWFIWWWLFRKLVPPPSPPGVDPYHELLPVVSMTATRPHFNVGVTLMY